MISVCLPAPYPPYPPRPRPAGPTPPGTQPPGPTPRPAPPYAPVGPGQIATSVILVLKTLIGNTKTLSLGYIRWAEVALTEHVWEKCATGFSFTNLIMTSKWFNSNQGRAPAHCLSRGYDDLCLLWWCDTKKIPTMCVLEMWPNRSCVDVGYVLRTTICFPLF